MKLTKYEHACFTLEKGNKLIVVDPGVFTHDLGSPENVVAIIVTHEHPDHFDPAALGALIAHNPDAIILAHESITSKLGETLPNKPVGVGDEITISPFDLKFVGGEHAAITPDMPALTNLGVIVDEKLYYPGDSFYVPEDRTEVLALPAAAPWCKISEVMDFLSKMKPRLAFPTHDAILSDTGKQLVDTMLSASAESVGAKYQRVSEPLEI